MYVKCEGWPEVLPDDDGIRPAGRPDECFYCHRKVGWPHGEKCACITKVVRAIVMLGPWRKEGGRRRVGQYSKHVPWHWSEDDVEFHLNESSWCTDNALDTIVWDGGKEPEDINKLVIQGCTCGYLSFIYDGVADWGPFREVRDDVVREVRDGEEAST